MLSKIPPFPGHSDPQSTAPSGGGGADIRVTQITASGGIFFSSEFPGDCPILRETDFVVFGSLDSLDSSAHALPP